MDIQAFFKLSYGLYVVSARSGEKKYGCIVNTLQQVTAEPPMLSVAGQQKQRERQRLFWIPDDFAVRC